MGKVSYQLAGADPKTKRKDLMAALKGREASTPEHEPGWHWEGPVPSQDVEDDVGGIDILNNFPAFSFYALIYRSDVSIFKCWGSYGHCINS